MRADSTWLRTLENETLRHAVVAFDVFGTLLLRDLGKPTDLFLWMEQYGAAPAGFAEKRQQAERLARAHHPRREITLDEIYRGGALGVGPETECAAELAVTTANPPLLSLCKALKKRGKKLCAISDMYLPKEQLAALLHAAGYPDFDAIYVSSAYGVQKRSGKLFRRFLEEEALAPAEVLFVGDDRRADKMGAAMAGISCYLIPARPALPHTAPPVTASAAAAYARVQNVLPGLDATGTLGAEILGPLLAGFAAWLQGEAMQSGGRLVLLARDMYLTREACRLFSPGSPVGYLKVSRRSLCPALLASAEDAAGRELLLDMLPREPFTVREITAFCGFQKQIAVPGFAPDKIFDLRVRPMAAEQEALLSALHGLAAASTEIGQQAALIRTYLARTGMDEPGAILVDIGSGGTTQRALEKILGKPLQGRYLACDERLHQYLPLARAKAYLFGGQPAPLWFWMGQPLLEYLISEPCGATVGYYIGADGAPHPCVADGTAAPEIKQIQAGTLAYLRRCAKGLAWPPPPPEEEIAPFLDMMRHPCLAEAKLLGDFQLEDGITYRLAAPRPLRQYLLHPAALRRDLMDSHWKIGFLKRLFRVPAPYDFVYRYLKQQ